MGYHEQQTALWLRPRRDRSEEDGPDSHQRRRTGLSRLTALSGASHTSLLRTQRPQSQGGRSEVEGVSECFRCLVSAHLRERRTELDTDFFS